MEASLKEAFYNDPFSLHHNCLRYMGQWNLETNNRTKKWLFITYQCIVFGFSAFVGASGLVDLYMSRSDMKKMIFNMCTTVLTVGIFCKNLHMLTHTSRLNRLRMNLFIDGWVLRDTEDLEVKEQFRKTLKMYRNIFYLACVVILPLWLVSSLTTLVWGPRALPFPVWTPFDIENDIHFAAGFVYHCFGGAFIVAITMHTDLAMFSILLQIAAHYKILARKIYKIGELYVGGSLSKTGSYVVRPEINKVLVKHKTKKILRACFKRQLILMGYMKDLEYCYNKPMLVQVIAGFLLSIGNGLELIVVSMNFNLKLTYQVGYSIIVIGDVFMCCVLSDLLSSQVKEVVVSLYDISWYEMDTDIKKDLKLIIMGAQINKPLTANKMFHLNQAFFLEMIKNIYSWLALTRQVVMKK